MGIRKGKLACFYWYITLVQRFLRKVKFFIPSKHCRWSISPSVCLCICMRYFNISQIWISKCFVHISPNDFFQLYQAFHNLVRWIATLHERKVNTSRMMLFVVCHEFGSRKKWKWNAAFTWPLLEEQTGFPVELAHAKRLVIGHPSLHKSQHITVPSAPARSYLGTLLKPLKTRKSFRGNCPVLSKKGREGCAAIIAIRGHDITIYGALFCKPLPPQPWSVVYLVCLSPHRTPLAVSIVRQLEE